MSKALEQTAAIAPRGVELDEHAKSVWAELAESIAERCLREANERAVAERAKFDLD